MGSMSVYQEEDPFREHPKYEGLGYVGSGAFGAVFKARKRKPNVRGERLEVAIKLLGIGRKQISRHVENELLLQSKCWHPHVVAVKDIFIMPKSLAVVMEYVPGGDLFSLVKDSGRGLTEKKARWIFQQLVMGVDYLHQMGIAQRDIKLENTLVMDPHDDWPHIKITDFGFCKSKEQSICKTTAGTCAYMAPEVILPSGKPGYCGQQADMWSCGIMLYVMLFCKYPFDIESPDFSAAGNKGALKRLMRAEFEFPSSPKISSGARDILRKLITVDPFKRLSATGCQSHPWFKEGLPSSARAMNAKCLEQSNGRWTEDAESEIRNLVELARTDTNIKSCANGRR